MTELAYQTPLLPKPEPLEAQPLVSSFADLVRAQFVTVRQSEHGIEALDASRHEHTTEADVHVLHGRNGDAAGARRVAELVEATVRQSRKLRDQQAEIHTWLELLAPHEETIRGLLGARRS